MELKSFAEQMSPKKILPSPFSSSLLLTAEMWLNAVILGVLSSQRHYIT